MISTRCLCHGRRKVHDYFLSLLCKSSIWFTEQRIFKIIIYFFNTSKCSANNVISCVPIWLFHRWKDFEAMNRKDSHSALALICPYKENILLDLPSSMACVVSCPNRTKNLECYLTFKCVHPLACSGRSIQKARAAGGMRHIFFNVIWIVGSTAAHICKNPVQARKNCLTSFTWQAWICFLLERLKK